MAAPSGIQSALSNGWRLFCESVNPTKEQRRAYSAIRNCKTPRMGFNTMVCQDCGHQEIHYNSCRNRNCPNCQGLLKELWIDKRKAEVIDTPYFHLVATVPAELNPLFYANQQVLYSLLLQCVAETLLTLSADKKYLGAVPGIIEVLHTWGQKLNYHPHIHCIVSGGGLSPDRKLVSKGSSFFLPAKVMAAMFRGKFLSHLQKLYSEDELMFSDSCLYLQNSYEWSSFRDSLYKKEWNIHVKETFNGKGNAIEYLGRYAYRIAITNARILSVTDKQVTFSYKDYRDNEKKTLTLCCEEFVRRFMMHVLPAGFQKIRYYGFLNNRSRKENLSLIFRLQGRQAFRSRFTGLQKVDILRLLWNVDIRRCAVCGKRSMTCTGHTQPMLC